MQTEQVAELDHLVKERYGVLVEEFGDYEREHLPDFRDWKGVRLQKIGITLGPEEIGEFGAPAIRLHLRADEIVHALLSTMRTLIVGAGGGLDLSLCFLDGHDLPKVYWKVPADQQATANSSERGVVKVRHVFAVRHL